jgi:hypothetical protein
MQKMRTKFPRGHRSRNRIEGRQLLRIQFVLGPLHSEPGQMKIRRPFFKAHQFPFHQRCQRRRWNRQPAQLCDRKLATCPRQLRQNRLLIVIQLRQPLAIQRVFFKELVILTGAKRSGRTCSERTIILLN